MNGTMKSPLNPSRTNDTAPLQGVRAHARDQAHVRTPIGGRRFIQMDHGDRLLSVHADLNLLWPQLCSDRAGFKGTRYIHKPAHEESIYGCVRDVGDPHLTHGLRLR